MHYIKLFSSRFWDHSNKSALAAAIFAVTVGCGFLFGNKYLEPLQPLWFSKQGSLTHCIEKNGVANEIEITESSIKKATRKASGFDLQSEPDGESNRHCVLKLA